MKKFILKLFDKTKKEPTPKLDNYIWKETTLDGRMIFVNEKDPTQERTFTAEEAKEMFAIKRTDNNTNNNNNISDDDQDDDDAFRSICQYK